MIELDEIIDVARFKKDGIGYVIFRESSVSKYIRKQVDKNILNFMVKEYIKAWLRRFHLNAIVKYRNLKAKILENMHLKKKIYNWWMFWRF
jgi:hypothetical protein